MNQSNSASAVRPRIGVDPWGESRLEAGIGSLPRKAEFLCTLEVRTQIDSVEVDFFVNRSGRREMEVWQYVFWSPCKLLSRSIPDRALSASEQYINALFKICRCWLGFQGVEKLVEPGLFGESEWWKLKHRIDVEWHRIGEAKTKAVQAHLAVMASKRRSAVN